MNTKSLVRNWAPSIVLAWVAMLDFSLSGQQTKEVTSPDGQIQQEEFLAHRIQWVGEERPSEGETSELLALLSQTDPGSGLEQFIARHPQSPWTPALHHALAESSRQNGRYTRALTHWDAAWNELKESRDSGGRELANHVLAGQLELLSSLGRVETLSELLKAAEGRTILEHNDRRRIEIAREALMIMASHPGLSYRCGSLALANIARAQQRPQAVIDALVAEQSTTHGISLLRLGDLSRQHGLGLVEVKRTDASRIPIPAVLHWAQNHYGAILGYRADIDCYHIVDPTFGDPRWVSTDVLDAEASGYFLVSANQRPSGWETVSETEAATVFGRGYPYNINDGRDEGCKRDPTQPNLQCVPCQGMPVYWVTEPYVNVWIADEPWSYTTSRGEQMPFRATFKQRDSITNSYGYPVPGLLHNWYSKIYIRGMPTNVPPAQAFSDWTGTLYLGTGGERQYTKNAMVHEGSKTRLEPSHGVLTDGTVYPVPGFTLYAASTNVVPAISWYDAVTGFRVFYPDGSMDRYGLIYWRTNTTGGFYECEALLTDHDDPLGNTTKLTYECYSNCGSSQQHLRLYRLKQLTDYDGKAILFTYVSSISPRIEKVDSPYGQTATFGYTSGQVSTITDAVQLTNTLSWDSQGRVEKLITPYGTNSFNYYEVPVPDPQPGDHGNLGGHDRINRAVTIVDANGGTNLYAYRFDSTNIVVQQFSTNEIPVGTPLGTLDVGSPISDTNKPYGAVLFRNSFHWNPRQSATLSTSVVTNLGAADYLKARLRHWLGDSNNVAVLDLISVEREPSADGVTAGQKTFYDYEGKSTNFVYLQGTNSQTALVTRQQPSGSTEDIWS